jgi:malate dehydrogenase
MHEVAIIGAGELGGALADVLARMDLATSIRLVDESGRIAEGKALDLMQAAALEGFAAHVTGGPDLAATRTASFIILADCATRGEWRGDEAFTLLRRLPIGRSRPVVCAGANQRDLVERAVREAGFMRTRVLGSSPEALAAAMRTTVASETQGSAKDVALAVLGIPPSQTVLSWDNVTIGGVAAARALDEPTRRRLTERLPRLWPPGPYGLAAAAARVIEGFAGRSRAVLSCFVAPDDRLGKKMRTAAIPVRLDSGSIVETELPALSVRDRIALDNAVRL